MDTVVLLVAVALVALAIGIYLGRRARQPSAWTQAIAEPEHQPEPALTDPLALTDQLDIGLLRLDRSDHGEAGQHPTGVMEVAGGDGHAGLEPLGVALGVAAVQRALDRRKQRLPGDLGRRVDLDRVLVDRRQLLERNVDRPGLRSPVDSGRVADGHRVPHNARNTGSSSKSRTRARNRAPSAP